MRHKRKLKREKAKSPSAQPLPNSNDKQIYPTNPSVAIATSANNSEEYLPKKESNFRSIDKIASIGIVCQLAMLLVVFWQLKAYEKSNDLISKQFTISKIPYLSVDDIKVFPPGTKPGQIAYSVINNSDNPAIITSYLVLVEGEQPKTKQDDIKKDWIAPHQKRIRVETLTDTPQATDAARLIMTGELGFKIIVECNDIFNHSISFTYSMRYHERVNTFSIEDTEVTGLPEKP